MINSQVREVQNKVDELLELNKRMTLQEFESKLQAIRARNGWRIELECAGVWIIRVYDKETNKLLASTGGSGLEGILRMLEIPFDKRPWV